MGREIWERGVRVICSVSRHNSQQDEIDDALVEEMQQRIRDAVRPILEDPRYEDVISFTDGVD